MFCYWEVSDDTIKEFNTHHKNYNDCIAVLKVTNLTKKYSYTIPVNPFANNYYIDVEDPGCNYQVELGRVAKNEFINIYTSNVAIVPTNCPQALADFSQEGILFGNYLCISDKKRFKIYGAKETYARFQNQSHTAFDGTPIKPGSSEEFMGGGSSSASSASSYSSMSRYFG
jgi:hypothetical protein